MKKLFSTMAVAAALFAGYNAYSGQNSNELSDVALANVEALAEDLDEPIKPQFGYDPSTGICPPPNKYKKWKTCLGPVLGGKEKFCIPSDC